MASEQLLLDPEVEHLLREIAADPRSSLLRVSRPSSLAPFFERSAPVGLHAAGLTSAERHLIHTHRSEIAYLLREACIASFLNRIDRRTFVHNSLTIDHALTPLPPGALQIRSTRALTWAEDECGDAATLLFRCIDLNPVMTPSISTMAMASLRLEPADSARIYAGFDLGLRGQPQTAQAILLHVLSGVPNRCDASFAWEDLGVLHSNEGRYDQAIAAERMAIELEPRRAEPLMNWLFNALLMAEKQQSLEAGLRLDELASGDHPCVSRFALLLARQRQCGDWAVPSTSRHLIDWLGGRCGPATRRIIDVLA